MKVILALAAPLLMLTACASPESGAKPEDTQVAQNRPCERGEAQTGSMLTKRVCGPAPTDEERRRMQDEAARMAKPTRGAIPGSGS
ncbi:hypothetical protein OU995_22155 [Roseateles sp. SL47]|uniref:hypothetical protein n=1 Tax=Roseateles sp. SL47 TaxID=2995138 RepID=UPI00227192B8|nr:hypothetical protein [Roseateles sp. SL47]WAC72236.1 hypothetical protein OU995_22155 [Roseateles sp. SL47]